MGGELSVTPYARRYTVLSHLIQCRKESQVGIDGKGKFFILTLNKKRELQIYNDWIGQTQNTNTVTNLLRNKEHPDPLIKTALVNGDRNSARPDVERKIYLRDGIFVDDLSIDDLGDFFNSLYNIRAKDKDILYTHCRKPFSLKPDVLSRCKTFFRDWDIHVSVDTLFDEALKQKHGRPLVVKTTMAVAQKQPAAVQATDDDEPNGLEMHFSVAASSSPPTYFEAPRSPPPSAFVAPHSPFALPPSPPAFNFEVEDFFSAEQPDFQQPADHHLEQQDLVELDLSVVYFVPNTFSDPALECLLCDD